MTWRTGLQVKKPLRQIFSTHTHQIITESILSTMMSPRSSGEKLCFGTQVYHKFTSTALCHHSQIMAQWWCAFTGSNASGKPLSLTSPNILKKTTTNHQEHTYSTTTQVSSPAQLRGQFAIVQGQQEHLKMSLQSKNKENTPKPDNKPPNQSPKATLYWTITWYCSEGPQESKELVKSFLYQFGGVNWSDSNC